MKPYYRPRRLRKNSAIRDMIRENHVNIEDFIMPIFIVPGKEVKSEVSSMPGVYQLSLDQAILEAKSIYDLGIKSVILFGIPEHKDEIGSDALSETGIMAQAIKAIKEAVPDLYVISDLCFCEYTDHGHCGIVENNDVNNDKTLEILAEQALVHAQAGVDMVAPSGMMDGMISSIRSALDDNEFMDIAIMSYAVKYSSAYYGPFRDAADSTPQFGDRKTYQMDPANINEAIREATLDAEEGADILMVKPALAYMDVISTVRQNFALPVAAYNVSGEYAMIKAAALNGWIDEEKVVMETMMSLKRAGADIIISYFAKDIAGYLDNEKSSF